MQRLSKESMNNCFFFPFPIFLLPSLLQEKFTRAQTFINMPYFSFFSLSPPKDVFFFFFLFFHHYLQSFFLMFPLPPIDISMKFFFTIGIMITLHKPPQTPFPLIYSCWIEGYIEWSRNNIWVPTMSNQPPWKSSNITSFATFVMRKGPHSLSSNHYNRP